MIDPAAVRKAWEEVQRSEENARQMELQRTYIDVCTCHYTKTEVCPMHKGKAKVDKFETGATRDTSKDKPDYEGFLSPLVLEAYGRFMHYNREMEDGSLRESDNWQLGIPRNNYMKSLWRHHVDLHLHHRGFGHHAKQTLVWTLCAIIFNASGYLHELLKSDNGLLGVDEQMEITARQARRLTK